MTTDYPGPAAVSPMQVVSNVQIVSSTQPDTGSLSWVMSEIREALGQSLRALRYLFAPDDGVSASGPVVKRSGDPVTPLYDHTTALQFAKTQLHQAHGALQMVDIEGVTIITETVENLLESVQSEPASGGAALSPDRVQSIQDAYQALIEYLEDLLAGTPHQPVKLFPYYKALLEIQGSNRGHPADLFFPDLTIRPQFELVPDVANVEPIDYGPLRKRFEMALLPFLKSADSTVEMSNAAIMQGVIAEISVVQKNHQSRAFWWVLQGFAEAVATVQISNELFVKQLFARINLQLRRVSQGSSSISERLLRDALFFIAAIQNPSVQNAQIRSIYRLDGIVPADFRSHRYGQVDSTALHAAKDHLMRAKNMWDRLAAGDSAPTQEFEHEMLGLSTAGSKLNAPSLAKLLRELSGIARHAANTRRGDPIGLEIATSLLFVENSLARINHLPESFSEHADAMTAHLLSVMAGDTPAESASWLDDIYREAQQKIVVKALAGEMLTSLRHVEKLFDEYFLAPAKREVLIQIDHVLHQIQGALAIQEQLEALAVVEHTRAALLPFLEEGGTESNPASQEIFERIAQNIGALGFYLETTQRQSDLIDSNDRSGAQNIHLNFDVERGVFRVNLLERRIATQTVLSEPIVQSGTTRSPTAVPPMETPPRQFDQANLARAQLDNNSLSETSFVGSLPPLSFPDVPTVEEELLQRQTQSVELALSLTADPDNTALHGQLKDALVQMRVDAALSDDHAAADRAQAAIKILNDQSFSASAQSLTEIIATIVPNNSAETLPEITAEALAQMSEEEADAELLEIFLSEAEDVLEVVRRTVPLARISPNNQENLIVLRRAFHTLKGSSRMIGMDAFGDASWSIEQVLSLWLTEAKSGTPELFALLDHAAIFLDDWIKEVYANGNSSRTAQILTDAAERVRDADAVSSVKFVDEVGSMNDSEEISVINNLNGLDKKDGTSELHHSVTSLSPSPSPSPSAIEEVTLLDDADAALFYFDNINAESVTESASSQPNAIEAIDNARLSRADENTQSDVYDPSAEIFNFPGLPEARQDDSIKKIGDLMIALPLYNIYLSETDQLVRLLSLDFSEWRHEPERPVAVHSIYAAHSLAGSSATVGFKPLQNVAHALEMVLQRMEMQQEPVLAKEFDIIESAVARAKWMLQQFAQSEMPYYEPVLVSALDALRNGQEEHSAHQAASAIDIDEAIAIAPPGRQSSDLNSEQAVDSKLEIATDVDAQPEHQLNHPSENQPVTSPSQQPSVAEPRTVNPILRQETKPDRPDFDPALILHDEIDADLLPVFVEEGRDILPQIESALRSWQSAAMLANDGDFHNDGKPGQAPIAIPLETARAILRHLHTIKGSARMAGAMVLGQHMHEMESHIEATLYSATPSPHVIDELLAHYDHGVQMFEELQHPRQANFTQPKIGETGQSTALESDGIRPGSVSSGLVGSAGLTPAAVVPGSAPAPWLAAAPAAVAVAQVRVNAEVLDRLVNQAGEVSIARSRLESDVSSLQQSLVELTENVDRLRSQLREIEIQAETQISSRMTLAGEREFDPLEFDRFTRLQELTRIMAESVNDVSSLQKSLTKTVESASADLVTQGRLTRDLQKDLMHVRMVQFASVAERLYRLTRQVSKEMDKRVNLDIRGSAVEIDRSVLEKMLGPFEHLLRNAIVHGIESRDVRRAGGKNDIGELKIEIRQNGNEILIQLSDDGQGLNLEKIRAKAESLGLLGVGQQLSEGEITDLIFRSGFSTVTEVTKLAGRGIGMDVVRSEAASIGGRVAVFSEAGKGTRFTIHLPLTLAVTQVVIFSTGGNSYAVPSALVEQVQHLKATALANAYNDGTVQWQDNRVPLYFMSALLGEHHVSPIAQQYSPIIFLRSGNDRVAIHVDAIVGNREVVVKNIGPQLSRLIGIVGATVLGSGDIVLILNPVPLALRFAQQLRALPKATGSTSEGPVITGYVNNGSGAVSQPMGAIGDIAEVTPLAPQSTAPIVTVQGLRTQKIVMVVDDSLTVRRVTQRMLSREGYQVVLAKDGIDALRQLQAVTPDVMLVDIEMPHMDGFDLTRNIRSDERTRHIPIIMITSRTAAKHRTYAMELGVNEYLGKPYQEDALLAAIGAFIKNEAALS
ncbi:Hpt domain-containing protein [Glaciimonas sp. PAMC28666]|uniref:hybrid sensor histidine kinase/response regulator n=1 Tax=Glaciimonas sp. PAMC28666 TaxID=2807626 RepID=UPI001F0434AF|nr:Hpt domain-containing protein [Glaciimonas sp. PAMC28666]